MLLTRRSTLELTSAPPWAVPSVIRPQGLPKMLMLFVPPVPASTWFRQRVQFTPETVATLKSAPPAPSPPTPPGARQKYPLITPPCPPSPPAARLPVSVQLTRSFKFAL